MLDHMQFVKGDSYLEALIVLLSHSLGPHVTHTYLFNLGSKGTTTSSMLYKVFLMRYTMGMCLVNKWICATICTFSLVDLVAS
jgi:hypothetical protein